MIKKYVKKPVEVMAMKLERSRDSVIRALTFTRQLSVMQSHHFLLIQSAKIFNDKLTELGLQPDLDGLRIPTLEGVMKASWGDYIIQGVQGEYYPCKPDIFEATYDEKPVAKIESYMGAPHAEYKTAKNGYSCNVIMDEFSKEDISGKVATENVMNSVVLE